ncbi:unnamed protein product [Pieris macdunnoughi]|uniref:Uncharacterized protein n=1 Tax=Pieris macdunnoughi TaxID=345717 RepID=A0A821VKB2_9NEOP|nr:unnamed protein product [Pieris macdunnoughi]
MSVLSESGEQSRKGGSARSIASEARRRRGNAARAVRQRRDQLLRAYKFKTGGCRASRPSSRERRQPECRARSIDFGRKVISCRIDRARPRSVRRAQDDVSRELHSRTGYGPIRYVPIEPFDRLDISYDIQLTSLLRLCLTLTKLGQY